MLKPNYFYFILFHLLIFVTTPQTVLAQSCDDDSPSFLEVIFSGLGNSSEDNEPQNTLGLFRKDPRPRSEKIELKYGVSTMIPTNPDIEPMAPLGLEMAIFKAISKTKKLYLGGSFSLHHYGRSEYDSTFGVYDRIVTNHQIMGFNLKTKYRFINNDRFHATIGIGTGLMTFYAKSHARGESCSCDETTERDRLKIKRYTKGSYDISLGIQVPLASFFDKISFDISYQSPGVTQYILKDDVHIEPDLIHYEPTVNKLQFVNVHLGLSHYF